MSKLSTITPLIMALAMPLPAQAWVLGELQVSSHLGQRLSGSIALTGEGWQQLRPDCFSVARPDSAANQALPWVAKYNISLRKGKDGARLLLTTANSLDEPLIALAVGAQCGADLVREYVVVLSPPPDIQAPLAREEILPEAPMKTAQTPRKKPRENPAKQAVSALQTHTWIIGSNESVQSLATGLYPDNARMRKAFATAVYRANPELAMEYSSHDTLPKGLALEIPDLRSLANSAAAAQVAHDEMIAPPQATQVANAQIEKPRENAAAPAPAPAPASASASDRLVISGDMPADFYPGDEAFRQRLNETQDGVSQLNQFMANQLQVGEAPSSDPAILELQTRLAGLQIALEKIRQAEMTSMAGVQVAEAALLEPSMESVTLAESPKPDAMEAPAMGVKQEDLSVRPPVSRYPWETMVALGGGMGALGIGLGLWLGYRRQRVPVAAWAAPVSAPLSAQGSLHSAAGVMSVFRAPLQEEDGMEPRFNLPQVREISSGTDPSEFSDLTDFMLATGRVESAAQFLRDFIEAEPDRALTPWIKLLNSYQALGKKKEFLWVAEQLNQRFNVARLRWGDSPDKLLNNISSDGKALPQSIEEMPHVCAKIVGLWGKPECYQYLEALLRDNRYGERQGFSLQVVQEMLFLMNLLQQEIYAEKHLI